MPEIPITDAAQIITSNPLPVLFCDTCALLDLIRLPYREKLPNNVVATLTSANKILDATTSRQIHLVLSPLVEEEWSKHAENTQKAVEQHFSKLDSSIKIAQAIACQNRDILEIGDILGLKLHDFLYTLSKSLVVSSLKIEKDNDITLRATNRTILNQAPASKGKELQDCVIYEHALHLMNAARNLGYTQPIIFFTSNTNDFCVRGSIPKEPIDSELATVRATLTTRWNWTLNELGI